MHISQNVKLFLTIELLIGTLYKGMCQYNIVQGLGVENAPLWVLYLFTTNDLSDTERWNQIIPSSSSQIVFLVSCRSCRRHPQISSFLAQISPFLFFLVLLFIKCECIHKLHPAEKYRRRRRRGDRCRRRLHCKRQGQGTEGLYVSH